MLKKLTIEQFVLIDRLELDLQSGLTILTGETGAGKSILLGAMGLILGEASKPDAIRQGSAQSTIEALFAPPAGHPVRTFLADHTLLDKDAKDFTIRRLVKKSGIDDIEVNGKPVDLDLLKEIGTYLVEIHGQFANQSLMDPDNQLSLLDLSGAFPPELFKNLADALKEVNQFTQELEDEKLFLAKHKSKARDIDKLVGTFDQMGMHDTFIAEVEEEHGRLRTAKETSEALQVILGQLIAGNGIVGSLASVNQTLARQKHVDQDKIAKLSRHLTAALENARGAVKEVGQVSPEYEIDTEPLRRYDDILSTLRRIAKENNVPFEDLTDFYNEQAAKLARIKNGKEKLAEINDRLINAKNKYREHAAILTEKRIAAAEILSKAVTNEFAPLKLPSAEFKVLVEEKQNIPWTEKGLNVVTFTARMNPGMPFSAISETASGGEMARMMLALKVIVQSVQTTPTLVFDEVDTGIGGAAASAVGERLAQLADSTQVLVITHSPQVASRGVQHLHVSKKTDGQTTTSVVESLSADDRIDELSRMLSGDTITPESHAAAKKLIDEAAAAAKARKKP